jgi:hypothetical protein
MRITTVTVVAWQVCVRLQLFCTVCTALAWAGWAETESAAVGQRLLAALEHRMEAALRGGGWLRFCLRDLTGKTVVNW